MFLLCIRHKCDSPGEKKKQPYMCVGNDGVIDMRYEIYEWCIFHAIFHMQHWCTHHILRLP